VGRVRNHNEDNFLIDKRLGLFIVADGMGGHAAGEIASAMAVRLVHEEVKRNKAFVESFSSGEQGGVPPRQILQILEQALQRASTRIHEAAQSDRGKKGMGTTCSALLLAGDMGFLAHAGDSRIYLLRNQKILQLTEDHTLHNDLMKRGIFSREQLDRLVQRNAITRALGIFESLEIDTQYIELMAGDNFLLCSDGLHNYLESHEDLLAYLAAEDDSGVKALIRLANERGGKDNITAIHIKVSASGPEAEARTRRMLRRRETLAQVRLFSRLSSRELRRVLEVAYLRTYKLGDVIMTEGEQGDELFVVLSGQLRVQRGEAPLSVMGPGDHVGEMAMIRNAPRSATVVCDSACELMILKRDDFFDLLRKEPELSVKLLWQFLGVLADRLDQASRDLRHARADQLNFDPAFSGEEHLTSECPNLPDIDVELFSSPPTQRGM
ncbi:MAG: cyclic nucleotide-binding domain-containing protein, partial [Myxococcales bacterium]|nr:cyclic nucleotide-binding domain-containing protein [Myxococcales bacterium]